MSAENAQKCLSRLNTINSKLACELLHHEKNDGIETKQYSPHLSTANICTLKSKHFPESTNCARLAGIV